MELEGTILTGREFHAVEGRLLVDDGEIVAIEETAVESADIILPAFVNAHTHVGDSIAKDAGRGLSLDDLVAPPDGLKHQLLAEADREEQIDAMTRSLEYMRSGGTRAFLDFREEGESGVRALREAASDVDIDAVVYGREEVSVLDIADGYGASGARDSEFETERVTARDMGKPFGIHAGERDPDDIHPALDLDPDHLVHMVYAEPEHLERVAEADIPIAVCPRSNLVTNVGLPDIGTMLEYTDVALGTDNVMLNSPSMFREMEFAAKCCDLGAVSVLRMATTTAAEVAGLEGGVIDTGEPAHLQVLAGDSDNLSGYQDPVRAAVRRAGVGDVKRVVRPANS